MISKIFRKAFKYSVIVQSAVVCIILFDSFLNNEAQGFEYGIYVSILSLQLYPFILLFFVVIFYVLYKIRINNN